MSVLQNSAFPHPVRKGNRLPGYDYSQAGFYFVTICAYQRTAYFWDASTPVGADSIRPDGLPLSPTGQIVREAICAIPQHYPTLALEKYVVMPNHVHLLLRICEEDGRILSAPTEDRAAFRTKALPVIIGQMKRAASKRAAFPIWQKGYHDHIIRDEPHYLRIWQYIDTNPAKWSEDRYYAEEMTPTCTLSVSPS